MGLFLTYLLVFQSLIIAAMEKKIKEKEKRKTDHFSKFGNILTPTNFTLGIIIITHKC